MAKVMLLRVIIAASLVLGGCSSPRRSRPRPRAVVSDSVDGCDRLELRALIETLGARQPPEELFVGRVPVAVMSTRLDRCVVGESLQRCRERFARRGRLITVEAETRVQFQMERIEPSDAFERRLADRAEGDARLDVGRRVRVQVLTDPVVCVREQALRRVRVEQSFGTDPDVLALLEARVSYPLMVFALPAASGPEAGRFSVRCAATDELTSLPELEADGPCGRFAPTPALSVTP